MKIAFLIGVGIGTASAVLMARRSGEETRQKISGTVEQGKKVVSDKVVDTVSKVSDAAHGTIDSVANRISTSDAAEPGRAEFPGREAQAS